jgi:hypothetical protein
MVAALDPLREADTPEKGAEIVEADASIRGTPQYSNQNRLTHIPLCAQDQIAVFQLFDTSRVPAQEHGSATKQPGTLPELRLMEPICPLIHRVAFKLTHNAQASLVPNPRTPKEEPGLREVAQYRREPCRPQLVNNGIGRILRHRL